MRRALVVLGLLLGTLMPASSYAQACDFCGKRIESLAQPVRLAGTWLFTRDDAPQNADPASPTDSWVTLKAPGPWKKAYNDGKVFSVGWYRGEFQFAPELVGREVVVLVNTYMAPMRLYVNGQMVYARPNRVNVERYYSIQAAPLRFKVPAEKVTLALRVETPLMTGVYQLPFELHAYQEDDASLVGWAIWGGELRTIAGWVALFFGMFFLLVFSKTRYGLYLAAALGSVFGSIFLIVPADYLAALVPIKTLTYLHYTGLFGTLFFFMFAQYFYRFFPRANWVVGVLLAIPAVGMAAMAVHENLSVFQLLRSLLFVVLLVVTLAIIYFYYRGAMLKRPGAKTMLVGMLLYFLGALNDMLLAVGAIQSLSLASTALILALGAMLYVSVQSFANTFLENKRLVGDLREVNENLEGLVSQRTAALREKTNDIQAMLQNMPQGVLTLTADGKVHPEYSAFLEQIYVCERIAGRDGMEFLFGQADLGADQRDSLSVAVASVIGEDAMNYEFNSHLLVPECDVQLASGQRKSLAFSWSPIVGAGDVVEKLMICVRDVTELKRLAAESAGQKRELELIGEILKVSQEKFQAFMESAQGFVAENRQIILSLRGGDREAVNLLFRNMHTIKGNARTYGLLHLTNVVHEAESSYDALRKQDESEPDTSRLLAELDAVQDGLAEYARINDQTLGRKGPGRRGSVDKFLMVDRQQLGDALGALQRVDRGSLEAMRSAIDEAEHVLRRIGTETLEEVLAGLIEGLPALAQELGKEAPVVRIDAAGLRTKSQLGGLLRNLFTHLLRNAVDHGLESAGERLAAGKPSQGLIELRGRLDANHLELVLRDDGRGLALSRIRARALENGLVEPGQVLSDQAIADLIFLPGFSTAESVTEVSGRGVGMDAVRDFLRREGGQIAVRFLDGSPEGADFRSAEMVIQLPAAAAVTA
ncbi:ATP-binding protein [Inhella sp.]|uniref:ATP-binding protein n=1 Tax=Inhella sp. TaxID=1921806 RepID=UPI0035AFC463